MNQKIKLRQIDVRDYERAYREISEMLRQQEPKVISLELESVFKTKSGIFQARLRPYAEKWNSTHIGFELDTDIEDEKRFKEILKTGVPNLEKMILEGRLWPTEEEIHNTKHPFISTTGIRYALVYNHDSNILSTSSMFSGHYANQRVLTWFFDSLGKVIDFDDLSYLRLEVVTEDNTCEIFKELVSKNRDYIKLAQAICLEYQRSPLMRLLYRQGFKDMTIIALRDEVQHIIGRREDKLNVIVKDINEL